MPFRFRKSIKLGKGFKLNLSKSGVSTSIGGKGLSLNLGKRGPRVTAGIPGSGISYSSNLTSPKSVGSSPPTNHINAASTRAPLSRKTILSVLGGFIALCCICLGAASVADKLGWLPTSTPTATTLSIEMIIAQTSSAAQIQTAQMLPTNTMLPTPTLLDAPATALPTSTTIPTATLLEFPTATIVFILPTQPPSSGGSGNYDNNGDGKVTCADFQTQAAAQQAYNAGYTELDGNDKDGKACESLP